MAELKTLAFEIGTEEIPAFDLHSATEQMEKLMRSNLDASRIPYENVEIYSSPRRLIAICTNVASKTEAVHEEFRGPAAKIAFDESGNPTKAAIGFAKSKGIDPGALEVREVKGTKYVYATTNTPEADVATLLPSVLDAVIRGISWPKSCRWGAQTEYFSRPVRWLLAMLDEVVIPLEFAGVKSGNTTCGHRVLACGKHEIATASALVETLPELSVVPSEALREQKIRKEVAEIEEQTGFKASLPKKTLLEVVNLCELPTCIACEFDEEFLQVPQEIIVDAMLMHQRYFPLYTKEGKLSNKFIVVMNGNPACAKTIANGNERVVRARLADAKFFYEEDLKKTLEAYVPALKQVVFQESLGSVLEKTKRIEVLAKHIGAACKLSEQEQTDALRAAHLCKADLVTNAVVEFTSVQGVMGAYYAQACGESEAVSKAIGQHYQPRFAGDTLPEGNVGKVVAVADKLDSICGLFAVGQKPTGSSDPFALRRACLGIIGMLTAKDALNTFKLADAIEVSLNIYAKQGVSFDKSDIQKQVLDFFITRTKVMLKEQGHAPDTIDAVLAADTFEIAQVVERVCALDNARENNPEVFNDLATAYARANNLRDKALGEDVDENLFDENEQKLFDAIHDADIEVSRALAVDNDYAEALNQLAGLREPIDAFFESTMIMVDDKSIRENRLKLLNAFIIAFTGVADFGLMAKAK